MKPANCMQMGCWQYSSMSLLDLCKPMSVYFVLTPNTPVLCVSSAIITSIKDLNMFFTKCSADNADDKLAIFILGCNRPD